MNILDEILNARDGQVVQQMADQFGLQEDDVRNAISSMLPALAAGMKKNVTASDRGAADLLAALDRGGHARYIDEPETLSDSATIDDGNSILGHVLGSKEVSRKVADRASTSTGLNQDTLKQLLPILATVAMGALSKNRPTRSGSDGLGALAQLIDLDKDGSVADDVLDFVRKLF